MKSQAILKADYLDILFDNRNKTYGGYDLRKTYHQRVKRALSIVMVTLVSAIAYPVIASNFSENEIIRTRESVVQIADLKTDLPEKKIVEAPKPVEPPKTVAMDRVTPPVIVDNMDVRQEDLLKENSEIKNPGPKDVIGEDPGIIPVKPSQGGGGGVIDVPARPEEIPVAVEQMPEYNGDMYAFLQKHMNYPDMAREAGIQGRVVVRFVVNEDGSIVNAKVVKGIGGGCDEEAIRVIGAMPKWRPGKNNGHAVKVYFTLPVNFRLD